MPNPQYSISTPENVDLHLELAGFGNRVLACIIDTLFSAALNALIVIGLLVVWFSLRHPLIVSGYTSSWSTYLLMIGTTLCFAIVFGYYAFFEGFWQGQTPGKRFADIRVIEQNGQPITWSSAIVRNLVRLVDQGVLLIGFFFMLVDKNERRLGDFAAGTIVIRERTPQVSTPLIALKPGDTASSIDVGRITPDEYDLLTTFLKRRDKLSDSRTIVARELEQHFKSKLGVEDSQDAPEQFLESVYTSYQSRAE